jgi:hypothetical protein
VTGAGPPGAEAFDDFVCTCDDAGAAAAAALRAEVRERIRARGVAPGGDEASEILLSLAIHLGVTEVGVRTEQWHLVSAHAHGLRTSIRCDSVVDGLAATWRAFAERAEGRVAAKMDG